jgi:hypothetical protein
MTCTAAGSDFKTSGKLIVASSLLSALTRANRPLNSTGLDAMRRNRLEGDR